MMINQIENIPVTVEACSHGFSTITFTLPDEHINAFVGMLNAFAGLFRAVSWKSKTNIDGIHQREVKRISGNAEKMMKFEQLVVDTFAGHLHSGYSPRESLTLTVSGVKYIHDFASYQIIKNILGKKVC